MSDITDKTQAELERIARELRNSSEELNLKAVTAGYGVGYVEGHAVGRAIGDGEGYARAKGEVPPVVIPPVVPPVVLGPVICKLTIAGTGAFTVGHAFKEGEVKASVVFEGVHSQCDVKNYWPDGSVKFAVLSGIGGGELTLRQSTACDAVMTQTRNGDTVKRTYADGSVWESTATFNPVSLARARVAKWLTGNAERFPQHDLEYLRDTKFVPNSGWRSPTTVVPGKLRDVFGGTGYDDQIGILPKWDALYLTSGAKNAYDAVLANAQSGAAYPVHHPDPTTGRPRAFSAWPNFWTQEVKYTNPLVPDREHQPSIGYLAYLLTADPFYLEEIQYWATFNAFFSDPVSRGKEKCIPRNQSRGVAWLLRTLATAAAITPDDDPLQAEFANSFRSIIAFYHGKYVTGTIKDGRGGPNKLGVMCEYSGGTSGDPYRPGNGVWDDAPWMQHFLSSVLGFTRDIVPLQSAEDNRLHNELHLHTCQHVVGMLGDSTGRPYQYAAAYDCGYGKTTTPNETSSPTIEYFPSWKAQWEYQMTVDKLTDPAPDSPLLGNSGGDPAGFATGYWGNLHPAISYAVDAGAPGAAAAYARLTSASNYQKGTQSFHNIPQFGIVPRGDIVAVPPVVIPEPPANPPTPPVIVVPPTNPIALPDWIPAPGKFRNISLNRPIDAKPPGYTDGMMATIYRNYTGRCKVGSRYALLSGGHLQKGEIGPQAISYFDINTRLFDYSNVAPNFHKDVDDYGLLNEYGEYPDGSVISPHTYSGLKAMGNDAILRFFFAGSRLKNAVHKYDLTQKVGGVTRAVDSIPFDRAPQGCYPMVARDDIRKGWWALPSDGSGPLAFVSEEFQITRYSAGYSSYGDNAFVHIPEHDILIAAGRANGDQSIWRYFVCDPKETVKKFIEIKNIKGVAPKDSRCGFDHSTLLKQLVAYNAHGGYDVHKLIYPTADRIYTDQWEWTVETLESEDGSKPSDQGSTEAGTWSGFIEFPDLRCFLFIDHHAQYMQAWRLKGM